MQFLQVFSVSLERIHVVVLMFRMVSCPVFSQEEEWDAFLNGHSTGVSSPNLRTIESKMIDRCGTQG
eukprot:4855521-Amphidinium_carterae.1